MTSSELQFAVIKDELTAMVDDIIRQFLNDKVYEKDQAQNWCNGISDEIIKSNMKMTKCTLSSAYSVLLHK